MHQLIPVKEVEVRFIGLELVVGLVAISTLAIWVWALADSLRRPAHQWTAAGQSQVVWVLVIVVANLIGSLLYLVIARPMLNRTSLPTSAPGH